jgi:hypothetical protein
MARFLSIRLVICLTTNNIARRLESASYPSAITRNGASTLCNSKENIGFCILSEKGAVLCNIPNTGASRYQNWGFSWLDNNRLLLKSSDIGDSLWERDSTGHWRETNPREIISPDRHYALRVYWEIDGKAKKVTLKVERRLKTGNSLISSLDVDLDAKDLLDNLSWDENELIQIKDKKGKIHNFKVVDGLVSECPCNAP